MFGRRSLNLELEPYDPEIERTFKEEQKHKVVIENPLFEMAEIPETKTLMEYFAPITADPPSSIVLPNTTAHFELRPEVIRLLPNFHGLDHEDPYMHLSEFRFICSTSKFQNFSDESVKLRLFPFSVKDKAKAWLNSQPPRSITSWNQLVQKFLSKFFPMAKTNELRREISDFKQTDDEKFYESWERFKDLLIKCPHHGFETWRLVQYFYNGLTQTNRNMIESMNGGAFLSLGEQPAYNFLERLSENSQQWDFSSARNKQPVKEPKRGGMYEVRSDCDLGLKIENLTRKVEALTLGQNMNSVNQIQDEACPVCGSPMHSAQTCPSIYGRPECQPEQVNALNNFRQPYPSPFSETYNPNWRNHPNFSYKSNPNPVNLGASSSQPNQYRPQNPSFPPGFQSTPQFVAPQQQPPSSLEDSLQKFMQLTGQAINDVKSSTQQNTQAIAKLEHQIGQLATIVGEREKGKFPSQPIPNPKGQFQAESSQEHANAIITLRTGKQIDLGEHVPHSSDKSVPKEVGNQSSTESQSNPLNVPLSGSVEPPVKTFVPKAPFPQRLAKSAKGEKFAEILKVFKQVQINLPFLDAIQQVPSYAKFLKDLCTVKRKNNVPKKAFLTEHVSSIIENRIPVKYKDPGCPTIPCSIGDHHIDRALIDLGASVNLLPYSVYEQLGLGEIKPTSITLSLADRSVKIPRGVVEDVLVKVDEFYYPVDFIVLDTQPVPKPDREVPVILGRPFLATCDALINCRNGVMKIAFGNMTVDLNIFNIFKRSLNDADIREINLVDTLVEDSFHHSSIQDPLEACLAHFGIDVDLDQIFEEVNALLDSAPLMDTTSWKLKVEPLPFSSNPPLPSVIEPPKLDLKPLPDTLKYAFLGSSDTLPVIIAPEDQEKTTFTCPFGTFAYRRMLFGLCNALATFQRCMISIFSDMVERFLEVFMDDFFHIWLFF